jgi:hypothetical protein
MVHESPTLSPAARQVAGSQKMATRQSAPMSGQFWAWLDITLELTKICRQAA